MLNGVLESIRQEYRTRRIARFSVWVLLYGAALWVVDHTSGGVPVLLWLLFWLAAVRPIFHYLRRFTDLIKHRALWRLRHRLIVTYMFIAVVPVLLIVLLVRVGVGMASGQLAAYLVTSRLRDHVDALRQLNRVVAHEARLTRETTPEGLLDRLQRFYVSELSQHAESYPGLEITVRAAGSERAFRINGRPIAKAVSVPDWLKSAEFAEVVTDQSQVALRAVDTGRTPVGELTLILSQPLTPELLDQVSDSIGPVAVLAFKEGRAVRSKSIALPNRANWFDFEVRGYSTLDPIVWGGGEPQHLEGPFAVSVNSRVMTLSRKILSRLGFFSSIEVNVFLVIAGIFFLIELYALVVGVQLTRSITTTVDKLHDATEHVKVGDFSYRTGLPARDQLTALGEAFDSMTASVERLLQESQEKSRLESEIEIARQVQSQLFPQTPPLVPGLRLYGVCKPARSVSGDYYDFLHLGKDRVGLVLGDVSGKGISAALLMAAIQSALRAQLYGATNGSPSTNVFATAEVVARLNGQLYENTPAEKYVTFFYAVYDGGTRRLTYTNAGHLPPVLFRRGGIERLTTGGTVVGLLSSPCYEQGEIQLEAGDMLLAFTDGITEPESVYEEEFGEERVLEVVQRALGSPAETLADQIFRSVSDWTGSPELQDDMTVVVAQAVP